MPIKERVQASLEDVNDLKQSIREAAGMSLRKIVFIICFAGWCFLLWMHPYTKRLMDFIWQDPLYQLIFVIVCFVLLILLYRNLPS